MLPCTRVDNNINIFVHSLAVGDDEMPIETYMQMVGEDITKLELSIDEYVDVVLGINYAQDLDLNVNLHSVDVDVAPPTVKPNDAKYHA